MKMLANDRSESIAGTEVVIKASRRRFGRDKILRILGEADKVLRTGRVVEVLSRP